MASVFEVRDEVCTLGEAPQRFALGRFADQLDERGGVRVRRRRSAPSRGRGR